MPLNEIYRKDSPVIATYNYSEILEGIGFQTFYLANVELTGGKDYVLVSNPIYSSDVYEDCAVGASGTNDFDFDLTAFNYPKTINGTAILNATCKTGNGNAGNSVYIIVKIIHYDGATETTLVTATSDTLTGDGVYKVFSMPLVIPKKHFKKGDILRLNIDVVVSGTNPGILACDPKDRTLETAPTTASFINIPFELN